MRRVAGRGPVAEVWESATSLDRPSPGGSPGVGKWVAYSIFADASARAGWYRFRGRVDRA
jgi:hypothetical protein